MVDVCEDFDAGAIMGEWDLGFRSGHRGRVSVEEWRTVEAGGRRAKGEGESKMLVFAGEF
jgi:hypothetical protein